jgi:LPS export ABC transporter protein LptC
MSVPARNLLLFLTLSAAAIVTWMLARDPEPASAAALETNRQRPPQGFYLVDTEVVSTDQDGRIFSNFVAERIDQRPRSDDFELTGIRINYTPDADSSWDLTAARGYMSSDQSYFDLDEIELNYSANNGDDIATIRTDHIEFRAPLSLLTTDAAIEMRTRDWVANGVGMSLNLEDKTYVLEKPDVTVRVLR